MPSCRTTIALGRAGNDPGHAFPAAAACPGQAGAGAARRHPRHRGRYPPLLADLRPACRGRAERGERARSSTCRSASRMASAPSRPDTEVAYKVTDTLRPRLRPRHRLGRPGSGAALAVRGCGRATVRQGPPGAAAAGPAARHSNEALLMRILVTGGAGFIGSALVRHLVLRTRRRRAGRRQADLCRRPPLDPRLRGPAGFEFLEADICDAPRMRAALARVPARRGDAPGGREPCGPLHHRRGRLHRDQCHGHLQPAGGGARLHGRAGRRRRRTPSASCMSRPTRSSARSGPTGAVHRGRRPMTRARPIRPRKAASDHLVRAWQRDLRPAGPDLQLLEQLRPATISPKS